MGELRLYRDGLADFLERQPGVAVAGSADGGERAAALAERLRPDIALLDMAMDGAVDAARALRAAAPDTTVVGLAIADVQRDALTCARAGVAAFVSRDDSLNELLATIRAAARGELHCSPRLAGELVRTVARLTADDDAEASDARLTRREREILALIERGLSNKQIAAELVIGVSTVKNHVHAILEKLHVDSRAAAAASLRRGVPATKPASRAPGARI